MTDDPLDPADPGEQLLADIAADLEPPPHPATCPELFRIGAAPPSRGNGRLYKPTAARAGTPAAEEPIRFLDLEAARRDGIPPTRWLATDWLAERDIVLLGGRGGIGKSTVAADLALALAIGRPWCGVSIVRPVRLLYFDEEQGDEEVARLFLRLLGGDPPPANLRVASGQGIRLDDPAAILRLEAAIREHEAEVVFFDSLQQVAGGADGNSAREVGALYRPLLEFRDTYGAAFVNLGHMGKQPAGSIRRDTADLFLGSVAFRNLSSKAWAAFGSGSDAIELRQDKRRGGGRKVALRVAYHEAGQDGRITLRGEPIEDEDTALEAAAGFVLDYLQGRPPERTGKIIEAAGRDGHKKMTAERALRFLVKSSALVQPRRGTYSLPGASVNDGNEDLPF